VNSLLSKNKPEDCEDFKKLWDNSGYTLRPLYKTIKQLRDELGKIKVEDFECPNHYAKLAYQGGQAKAYDLILSLLPDTAKD
jgi:hypothetical protein